MICWDFIGKLDHVSYQSIRGFLFVSQRCLVNFETICVVNIRLSLYIPTLAHRNSLVYFRTFRLCNVTICPDIALYLLVSYESIRSGPEFMTLRNYKLPQFQREFRNLQECLKCRMETTIIELLVATGEEELCFLFQ